MKVGPKKKFKRKLKLLVRLNLHLKVLLNLLN